MNLIGRYLWNWLVWLDEGLNTLTGGDCHETCSSRLGKMDRGDYGFIWRYVTMPLRWTVDFVALHVFGQANHCAVSLQFREGLEDILVHDTVGEES